MWNVFNTDNPVYKAVYKLVAMILLGVLWIICSIPVITFGAATAALYYAVVKAVRYEQGQVFSAFFATFRSSILKTLIPSLIFILAFGVPVLGTVISFQISRESGTGAAMPYLAAAAVIPASMIFPYFFPVFSRFDLKLSVLFINSFYYSVRHFASTVLFDVLIAGTVWAAWRFPYLAVFMPGICCWLISIQMEKILRRYTEKPDDSGVNGSGDTPWYLRP